MEIMTWGKVHHLIQVSYFNLVVYTNFHQILSSLGTVLLYIGGLLQISPLELASTSDSFSWISTRETYLIWFENSWRWEKPCTVEEGARATNGGGDFRRTWATVCRLDWAETCAC